MASGKNEFNLGEEVIAKDGTIFVITGVEVNGGRFTYSGKSKKKSVRYDESSLKLYFANGSSVKVHVAYAYKNLRTGEIKKYVKQKNENQHSVRFPIMDERYVE